MAMLMRIDRQGGRNGRTHGGWLVMEYGEPNIFHLDDGTMSEKEVQQMYGGIIKGLVRVTGSEWQRFVAKVTEG